MAGQHPLAALARLAAVLAGRSAPADAGEVAAPGHVPGPETVADAAQRLGLGVQILRRSLRSLTNADLPCVILMKDGTAEVALRRPDRATLELLGPAGDDARVSASVRTLAARASGAVFCVRPGRVQPVEQVPATAPAHRPLLSPDLAAALKSRAGVVVTLVVSGLVSNAISLAMPLFTMTVFDRIVPHGATETLWALALGVTLLFLIDFGIRHARLALFDSVSLVAGQSMAGRLYSRLVRMPLALAPRTAGPLVQPFPELAASAQITLQFLVGLATDLPFFLVVVVVLAALGGPVALVPLVGAALLFAVYAASHAVSHRAAADETRSAQRQWQMLIESVSAIESIKAAHAGTRLMGEWERRSDDAAYSAHRPRVINGFSAQAGSFVAQMVVVATVVIGVDQIGRAAMTLGALSASMLLVSRSMTPVASLIGLFFRMRHIRATTRGLAAVMDTPPEHAAVDVAPAPGPFGAVECRTLTFRYPGAAHPALRDVTFAMKPGERIGLVGRAGCGKSTLLRLVARLYEPEAGTISFDGRDARQFDPDMVRRRFALMAQDSTLLEGTLESALLLGLGAVDPAHLDAVAKLTGVHEVAARHPAGYGLDVGPGGRRLSGGERQAVALARALMGRPALLLLDEPTSAMDNDREARTVEGLRALPREVGMVIATHRLPLLAAVDRVVWMDGGRVVADGPRDEVFRKLGVGAA